MEISFFNLNSRHNLKHLRDIRNNGINQIILASLDWSWQRLIHEFTTCNHILSTWDNPQHSADTSNCSTQCTLRQTRNKKVDYLNSVSIDSNSCSHLCIRPWIQHAQREHTKHSAHHTPRDRVHQLKYRTKTFHNNAAQHAVGTEQEGKNFHT